MADFQPPRLGDVMRPESVRRSVLILGGASSGKSAFAQRLASSMGARVLFVATAWPSDREMEQRIARHQAERPPSWRLIERPASLQGVTEALGDTQVVLFDSLSLWLAGRLPDDATGDDQDEAFERSVRSEVQQLFGACAGRCHLVVVSDEVGLGLVPPYPSGRRYRELLGRLNQTAAAAASTVYLIVAGIPRALKGSDGDAVAVDPL